MSDDCISADEWQLLSFFEVEPDLPAGEPWPYTDALYCVVQGDAELSCAIAPAHRDVRLVLSRSGSRQYELNAMGVRDVLYSKDEQGEVLEIVLTDTDSIQLRLKPRIEILQDYRSFG